MTSRLRFAWIFSLVLLPLGCSDGFNAGSMKYVEHPRLETDLKDKPVLQGKVRTALVDLFGAAPNQIKVPAGSGLPEGGAYLANYVDAGKGPVPLAYIPEAGTLAGTQVPVEGGYSLYRKHCLHCHGVSGAGGGAGAWEVGARGAGTPIL